MHIILAACCFTAAAAAWERRRIVNLFDWQLYLDMLVLANGMTAVGVAQQGLGLTDCLFAFVFVNLLCILTYSDMRTQYVETLHLHILLVCGVLCTVLSGPGAWISRLPLFLLIYLVLSLMARKEQSGIGSADAKVIAILALYMDFSSLFTVLFFALGAGLAYGIILMLLKKITMKTALPFMPFIWIGTLAGFIF